MVTIMRVFAAPFVSMIVSIVLTVGVLVGVITSTVVVLVIVTKSPGGENTWIVVRADISVAINRLIVADELDRFYSKRTTLDNIINSTQGTLSGYFNKTFVKVIISTFTEQPVLINNIENRRKRSEIQPSLVIVNGSIYFLVNYTKDEIRKAMQNYTQAIVLIKKSGDPSSAIGVISLRYSVFTDTYPCDYTVGFVKNLQSINVTDDDDEVDTSSNNTISTKNPANRTTIPVTTDRSSTVLDTRNSSQSVTEDPNDSTPTTATINGSSISTDQTNLSQFVTEAPNDSTQTPATTNENSISTDQTSLSQFATEAPNDFTLTPATTNGSSTDMDQRNSSQSVTEDPNDSTQTPAPTNGSFTNPDQANLTLSNTEYPTTYIYDSTDITDGINSTVTTPYCHLISQVNISISVKRPMVDSDLYSYYNVASTFQDLSTSLNEQIISYFSSTFIKFIILEISGAPVLTDNKNASLVTIDGQIYFAENYTTTEIYNALKSYAPIITLMTSDGNSSSAISAVFSLDLLSSYPIELMEEESRFYMCFPLPSSVMNEINSASQVNTSTICQLVFKADLNVGIEFSITSPELAEYDNTTSTFEYLVRSINEYMISNLPQTFINYFIANISTAPVIISNNNTADEWHKSNQQSSIITIDGSIYLLDYYTSQDILDIFQAYTPTIILKTSSGDPSSVSGNFSTAYSNSTDTYSMQLSIEETTSFTCIPVISN